MRQPERTRVLIVEDHKVVADGLALLLADDSEMEVVATVGTGKEAIESADELLPDVVVMDFRLPDQTGAEAAAVIKAAHPGTALLFLSADDSDGAVLAAVRAGASGYLVKTEAGARLVDAVSRAAAGEMLIPAWQLAKLVMIMSARERAEAEPVPESPLTARELEVLVLMSEGLANKSIAERLGIRPSTASWHVQSVLQKLDAHSKLEAVAVAGQRGILPR